MRPAKAVKVLRRMVLAAGVNPAFPSADDVLRTWRVFQEFSALKVKGIVAADEDGDGLLVQYGVYDWHDDDGEHFSFDFTRQFIHDDGDEDNELSQLNCTFLYDVTPAHRSLPSENLWSFGLSRDDYFAQAAGLAGFQQVLALNLAPRRLDIGYESDIC
jgi:hypothetical protein